MSHYLTTLADAELLGRIIEQDGRCTVFRYTTQPVTGYWGLRTVVVKTGAIHTIYSYTDWFALCAALDETPAFSGPFDISC